MESAISSSNVLIPCTAIPGSIWRTTSRTAETGLVGFPVVVFVRFHPAGVQHGSQGQKKSDT